MLKFYLLVLSFLMPHVTFAEIVFNYKLYEENQVVYCGISNDPKSRMQEHREKKLFYFDRMAVYFANPDESSAYENETQCIESHDIPSRYQLYPRRPERSGTGQKRKRDFAGRYPEFILVNFTRAVQVFLARKGIDYLEYLDSDSESLSGSESFSDSGSSSGSSGWEEYEDSGDGDGYDY